MKIYSLNEFLIRNLPEDPGDDAVLKLLLTDSQELLLVINSILLSDLFLDPNKTPSNTSGNVFTGLVKPSLGKLLNLSFWLSQNVDSERIKPLKNYLLTDERKKQGWITRLLQLRNAYAHPRGKTREDVSNIIRSEFGLQFVYAYRITELNEPLISFPETGKSLHEGDIILSEYRTITDLRIRLYNYLQHKSYEERIYKLTDTEQAMRIPYISTKKKN